MTRNKHTPGRKLAKEIERTQMLLWEFRKVHEKNWPTPSPLDSFRFAVTEIGEALDAFMRHTPDFSRNRERSKDVLDELADCAFMIVSALTPKRLNGLSDVVANVTLEDPPSLDEIVIAVSNAFAYQKALADLEDAYHGDRDYYTSPDNINELNVLLEDLKKAQEDSDTSALFALVMIAYYPHMKLDDRVQARLQRIETRLTEQV